MVYNRNMTSTEKDMENLNVRILKNFLSDEDVKLLKESIAKEREENDPRRVRIEALQSRQVSDFEVPESVTKAFLDGAHKYGSPTLKEAHHTFFEYSGRYNGETHCAPHTDRSASYFSMNYQLDANVSWELYVNGKEYLLENNDLLIFSGTHQIHWRPRRDLTKDEHCGMVIFHFAEPDHWRFSKLADNGAPLGENPTPYEVLTNMWQDNDIMAEYWEQYLNDKRYEHTLGPESKWII